MYNIRYISGSDPIPRIELAHQIIDMTNSSSKVHHEPLPTDDPKQRRPDITLSRETLKWEPSIALEDGLRETIGYFDTLIKGSC